MAHVLEYPKPPLPPKPKATKGFVLSLIAGILTMLAGISATILTYFYVAFVPAWLIPYRLAGVALGLILGILIILGAFLIWQDSLGFGGALVFLCSLANIYLVILYFIPIYLSFAVMGIGLVALILGLIGGVIGVFGK